MFKEQEIVKIKEFNEDTGSPYANESLQQSIGNMVRIIRVIDTRTDDTEYNYVYKIKDMKAKKLHIVTGDLIENIKPEDNPLNKKPSSIFRLKTCIEAPRVKKRFLLFLYEADGKHHYKITCIKKFMPNSTDFVVKGKCVYCGSPVKRHFVEYDELYNYGFKSEFLNGIGTLCEKPDILDFREE